MYLRLKLLAKCACLWRLYLWFRQCDWRALKRLVRLPFVVCVLPTQRWAGWSRRLPAPRWSHSFDFTQLWFQTLCVRVGCMCCVHRLRDVMFGSGRKVTWEQKQGVQFLSFFLLCNFAWITKHTRHTLDIPLSAVLRVVFEVHIFLCGVGCFGVCVCVRAMERQVEGCATSQVKWWLRSRL